MIPFIIGLVIGFMGGFLITAMLIANREDDPRE